MKTPDEIRRFRDNLQIITGTVCNCGNPECEMQMHADKCLVVALSWGARRVR